MNKRVRIVGGMMLTIYRGSLIHNVVEVFCSTESSCLEFSWRNWYNSWKPRCSGQNSKRKPLAHRTK